MYALRKTTCVNEAKFAYDQTLEFRLQVRRTRLAGLWAAARIGVTDADRYAHDLVDASFAADPHEDLATKLRHEFDAAGVAVVEEELQAKMADILFEAARDLKAA